MARISLENSCIFPYGDFIGIIDTSKVWYQKIPSENTLDGASKK